MCGCTHTVARITAAVNEALRPILNEMREDISSVKSDIMVMKNEMETISQSFSNQTEEVNTRLSGLNKSLRDDFSGVERELSSTANIIMAMKNEIGTLGNQTEEVNTRLSGLNESMRDDFSSAEDMICGKIEEHDNQTTTALMRMNQTLTEQIIINRDGLKGGGTWGWRRAVYLDMTDPNTNCPSGWLLTGYSRITCGRANSSRLSCDSVFFPVSGGPYSQVCGRIRAYQYGLPDAFYGFSRGQTTSDSAYVCGVAVMYGSLRQHIWTFANGPWENSSSSTSCPCDTKGVISIPLFVGEDYFCESGYVSGSGTAYIFHSNDLLWDGRDCHSTSTCCSLNNPPYFTKTLSQTTTDDLELRLCLYNSATSDNIAVELVELYVK